MLNYEYRNATTTDETATMVTMTLTPQMLVRLAEIPDEFKEKGDRDDPTRLCNSWKGAPDSDKIELKKLVTDLDMGGKLTAGQIKKEYPKFRIYTTSCLTNSVGNYRRKAKDAVVKRGVSKLFSRVFFVLPVLYTNNYSILYYPTRSGKARRRWRGLKTPRHCEVAAQELCIGSRVPPFPSGSPQEDCP